MAFMYRIVAALSLLPFTVVPAFEPITINAPLLAALDGKIEIEPLMRLVAKLRELIVGIGPEKNGLIRYKEKHRTLKELVAIVDELLTERELAKSDPEKEKDLALLQDAHDNVIDYVQKAAAPVKRYITEPSHKAIMSVVIEIWIKQREKNESALPHWINMAEKEFLATHAKTLRAFYHFLEDLITLLLDVRHTCKKSEMIYLRLMESRKLERMKRQAKDDAINQRNH